MRNRLSKYVLNELITHWELNGSDANERKCKDHPGAYLRAMLSLVPKDFALTVEQSEFPQYIELRFTNTLD